MKNIAFQVLLILDTTHIWPVDLAVRQWMTGARTQSWHLQGIMKISHFPVQPGSRPAMSYSSAQPVNQTSYMNFVY